MDGDPLYYCFTAGPVTSQGQLCEAGICLDPKTAAQTSFQNCFSETPLDRLQQCQMASPSGYINVMMMRDPETYAVTTIIRAPIWTMYALTLMSLRINTRKDN